jgi:hypothetical protein
MSERRVISPAHSFLMPLQGSGPVVVGQLRIREEGKIVGEDERDETSDRPE